MFFTSWFICCSCSFVYFKTWYSVLSYPLCIRTLSAQVTLEFKLHFQQFYDNMTQECQILVWFVIVCARGFAICSLTRCTHCCAVPHDLIAVLCKPSLVCLQGEQRGDSGVKFQQGSRRERECVTDRESADYIHWGKAGGDEEMRRGEGKCKEEERWMSSVSCLFNKWAMVGNSHHPQAKC